MRKLENAIGRAVVLCESDVITPQLLAMDVVRSGRSAPVQDSTLSLEDYFRRFVLDHQDQLTKTESACHLGLARTALLKHRQRLGIPRPKEY